MKFLIGVFLSIFIFDLKGQIVSISSGDEKNQSPKTAIYLKNIISESYRTVADNPYYNYSPIAELSNEKAIINYNMELGIVVPMSKFFFIETGIGLYNNGETSSFEDLNSDSTFTYTNRFSYFGMPIKLKWIPLSFLASKNKFEFGICAGVIPQVLFSYRQERNWTTSYGSRGSEDYKIKDNINTTNLCAVLECDLAYIINNEIAFHLVGSYRKSYLNSFNQYGPYSRFAFGYGIGLGISKFF